MTKLKKQCFSICISSMAEFLMLISAAAFVAGFFEQTASHVIACISLLGLIMSIALRIVNLLFITIVKEI